MTHFKLQTNYRRNYIKYVEIEQKNYTRKWSEVVIVNHHVMTSLIMNSNFTEMSFYCVKYFFQWLQNHYYNFCFFFFNAECKLNQVSNNCEVLTIDVTETYILIPHNSFLVLKNAIKSFNVQFSINISLS